MLRLCPTAVGANTGLVATSNGASRILPDPPREIIVILGLIGFAGVSLWLSQKSRSRDSRGDASAGFCGNASAAGHVHSDHCGHG